MLTVNVKQSGACVSDRVGLHGGPHGAAASDLSAGFLLQELLHTYDFLGVGLAIVTADGRLLHCNAAAERILAERDGIELAPSGILRFGLRNASVTQALARQSRETPAPAIGDLEPLAILAVTRPSGKRPLTVLAGASIVTPMHVDANPAASLLFLIDPEISRKGIENYARLVYGLTPAETDLASLLMQGRSLADCCARMEIRRPTAASHLRRLFQKTKTKTQSQLVSLLFRRCGVLSSEMRSTNFSAAALHLLPRTVRQHSPVRVPKVMQAHSFGGRQ